MSQHTATALLVLLVLYAKNWFKILEDVLQTDKKLAVSLLDMKNQELKQEDVLADWDLSKFLQDIYTYCLSFVVADLRTADPLLREMCKITISSSEKNVELIDYCLTSVKNEIQNNDLDGKKYYPSQHV